MHASGTHLRWINQHQELDVCGTSQQVGLEGHRYTWHAPMIVKLVSAGCQPASSTRSSSCTHIRNTSTPFSCTQQAWCYQTQFKYYTYLMMLTDSCLCWLWLIPAQQDAHDLVHLHPLAVANSHTRPVACHAICAPEASRRLLAGGTMASSWAPEPTAWAVPAGDIAPLRSNHACVRDSRPSSEHEWWNLLTAET